MTLALQGFPGIGPGAAHCARARCYLLLPVELHVPSRHWSSTEAMPPMVKKDNISWGQVFAVWMSDKFRDGTLPVVNLDRSREWGFSWFARSAKHSQLASRPRRKAIIYYQLMGSGLRVLAEWRSRRSNLPCLANADCLREHKDLTGSHRVRFLAFGRRRPCVVYHLSVHSAPTAGDLAPSSVPYWLRHETCSGHWGKRA
jgi:hypothetical protein